MANDDGLTPAPDEVDPNVLFEAPKLKKSGAGPKIAFIVIAFAMVGGGGYVILAKRAANQQAAAMDQSAGVDPIVDAGAPASEAQPLDTAAIPHAEEPVASTAGLGTAPPSADVAADSMSAPANLGSQPAPTPIPAEDPDAPAPTSVASTQVIAPAPAPAAPTPAPEAPKSDSALEKASDTLTGAASAVRGRFESIADSVDERLTSMRAELSKAKATIFRRLARQDERLDSLESKMAAIEAKAATPPPVAAAPIQESAPASTNVQPISTAAVTPSTGGLLADELAPAPVGTVAHQAPYVARAAIPNLPAPSPAAPRVLESNESALAQSAPAAPKAGAATDIYSSSVVSNEPGLLMYRFLYVGQKPKVKIVDEKSSAVFAIDLPNSVFSAKRPSAVGLVAETRQGVHNGFRRFAVTGKSEIQGQVRVGINFIDVLLQPASVARASFPALPGAPTTAAEVAVAKPLPVPVPPPSAGTYTQPKGMALSERFFVRAMTSSQAMIVDSATNEVVVVEAGRMVEGIGIVVQIDPHAQRVITDRMIIASRG